MHSGVQYVREICKQRKIPIRQLEKDCGFSNGYLDPKKINKVPYERAVKIAEYLDISVDDILNGPENKKVPTQKGEHDGSEIIFALSRGGEQEITPEMFEEVKQFAAFVAQREENKK